MVRLGSCWVTLGSFWDTIGSFWVTIGSCWDQFDLDIVYYYGLLICFTTMVYYYGLMDYYYGLLHIYGLTYMSSMVYNGLSNINEKFIKFHL